MAQSGKFDSQGKEQLYEQLYKRYYLRLFHYSIQFTKNEQLAQDLVHEVFLKLWEKDELLDHESIGSLLFTMIRNICLNYSKHQKIVENARIDLKSITLWDELYRIEFVKDEPYFLIEKELEQKIQNILEDLPEKCKEVFIMSRVQGLKNREIANQLNISLKTVEKHISRALRAFKEELPLLVSIQSVILILHKII